MPPVLLSCFERSLPLLDTAAHRRIEARSRDTDAALMARAGAAAAAWIGERLAAHGQRDGEILVCAGPGNNGGDGLLSAACLHRQGHSVRVLMPAAPCTAEARAAHAEARAAGVPIATALADDFDWQRPVVAVDALFGLGLSRALQGPFAAIAERLSARTRNAAAVLALDLPSGLDADTGRPVAHGPVVEAGATLSFIALKPGLFTGKGRDYTGQIHLAPLDLPDGAEQAPADWRLNAPVEFLARLPRRNASSHKGTFGSLAVVGGDTGTCGATLLCARAALYAGAGRVHAALLGAGAPAYDAPHPEIMLRAFDALDLDSMDALSVGAGMGQAEAGRRALDTVLAVEVPAVLDADALNLIAKDSAFAARVRQAGERLVLTPHPGEAARLLGCDTADIEAERRAALDALVHRFGATVVLKGAGTLIGAPSGARLANPTGNAGLASGGTGDVLGGLIGAYLAQGLAPRAAAAAAVFWHGLAAQTLARAGTGPAGLSAGELAPEVRRLMNQALRTRDAGAPLLGAGPLY